MKITNMAAFGLTCLIILGLMNSSLAVAEEFKVGDAEGWRVPGDNNSGLYQQWSEGNKLHVGDSLYFEYMNDSVLLVEKFGFYHCDMSKPLLAFKDGKTRIKLERPGPFYFISGFLDHCKNGQRLAVDVVATDSPPSVADSPEYYVLEAPAPSPLRNSGILVAASSGSVSLGLIATLLWLLSA